MKKMILAFIAFITVTAVQAQENNAQGNSERRDTDRTEMTKRRTEDAVKKYGLNDDQAAKLLALNTKYADKMGPGRGGMRGGRGMRPRPDFGNGQQGERPQMTDEQREQFAKARQERQEATKQYEAELQQILTPEQYKAYQADQEAMRKNFGRRGQDGQRGGRRNNSDNTQQ